MKLWASAACSFINPDQTELSGEENSDFHVIFEVELIILMPSCPIAIRIAFNLDEYSEFLLAIMSFV